MRALICGDIHGNLPALEIVLKKEYLNYDLFVSHGDVVNYAPWSNECLDCLMSIDDKVLLLGNHEDNYLKGTYSGQNIVATTFFNFCYPFFDRFQIIKEFGEVYDLGAFSVQHTIDDRYIFPDSDVESILETKKNNFIIGHSHHQFMLQSDNGYRLYNTGSVGQNRKNLNIINYIIYDTKLDLLEMKSLEYDARVVINEMKSRRYPEICIEYYQSKIK